MNKKKLNNNGFSLVELIIVIAIMAVLVGVLAPQYVRYVEKSKVSTDIQLADSLKGAMEAAYIDPSITVNPGASGNISSVTGTLDAYWTDVMATMGVADGPALNAKLKSKGAATSGLSYTFDSTTGAITVSFTHDGTTETVQ